MDFLKRGLWWFFSFAIAVILVAGYFIFFAPPSNFPAGDSSAEKQSIIVISRGASASDISERLSEAHIIKHPVVLQLVLRISGMSSRVKSGAYLFSTPENVFVIANRLATGAYGLPLARITFPEGMTARDIAKRAVTELPLVLADDILTLGKLHEGYLFPDTYFFQPDATAPAIVDTMRANFDTKIAPLMPDVKASGHSIMDIVIMASLVEKEARTIENRRIVAGVLWNRLNLGMPLQVDAVFGYIFNRDTYSPSFTDLKVNSPYNTYTHTGLPPGPIANPGLESLRAALYPAKTKYLYYLTGSDTLMHYATTYAEHQSNQRNYLR